MEDSAIDWFYDKIRSHFEHDGDLLEVLGYTRYHAQEKFKLQILDAYQQAEKDCGKDFLHGDLYYTETFKSK